jgi:hypothetical protein
MKTLLKIIKTLIITIVVLVGLAYGSVFVGHKFLFKIKTSTTPTIAPVQNEEFTFGVQAHTQVQTMEEYVALLGRQVANYQRVAPSLWVNNALVNRRVIVEAVDSGKFWLITPEGEVTTLTMAQALDYGISRAPYAGGFSEFEGGIYLAVTEESLHNVLAYQKYLHLGTYDPFITFAHEDFHGAEQMKWAQASTWQNTARNEFMDDTGARAKRDLLQRQLLEAIANPGATALILEALATYDDYKIKFPQDFENSIFADRIEGTAYYYELVASIYASYPDKVKTPAELERALALLATRPDVYVDHGLTAEGYNVGGFACILLDRLESDWQTRLMADATLTPIQMLRDHFAAATLPAPKQLTEAEIAAVGEKLNAPDDGDSGLARLFSALYQFLF